MSNYRDNAKAIDRFRKELRAMLDDVREIDKKVLNGAVNGGVALAKKKTIVGKHPNPVTFTVKRGPEKGKVVSFEVKKKSAEASACAIVGGWLRWNWHKLRTIKTPEGVETELVNSAEYASYWNDGHRIVNKAGGVTKGIVKGTHVLEETGDYIEGRMAALFEKEVKAVQKEHDK